MICPKCGQEYSGSQCPRCNGPEIVVNNSDYLERRKVYEESLKAKKSEGKEELSKSDVKLDEDLVSELISKVKTVSTSGKRVKHEKDIVENKDKDIKKNISLRTKTLKDNKAFGFILKNKKKVIAAAGGLVAAIILIIVLFNIFGGSNEKLYAKVDGGIYLVNSESLEFVCNDAAVVYKTDGLGFAEYTITDIPANEKVVQSMASENGKFISYVTYDDSKLIYSLYISGSNGNETVVVSNAYEKKIISISNDGNVIYTDSNIVNELWSAVGNIELFMCKITENKDSIAGSVTQIDGDIRSVSYYSDKNILIIQDADGSLYSYSMKNTAKTGISDDAGTCYYLSENLNGMYAESTGVDVTYKDASSIIYLENGKYIYADIVNGKSIDLGKLSGSSMSFAYDSDNGYFYAISSSGIKYSKVTNSSAGEFVTLDTVNSKVNGFYMNENNKLYYVNEKNEINVVQKGIVTKIFDNVKISSFTEVEGKQGVSFISGESLYYIQSDKETPALITEKANTTYPAIVNYKDKLYYYDKDGVINVINVNGENNHNIKVVDRIWIVKNE